MRKIWTACAEWQFEAFRSTRSFGAGLPACGAMPRRINCASECRASARSQERTAQGILRFDGGRSFVRFEGLQDAQLWIGGQLSASVGGSREVSVPLAHGLCESGNAPRPAV